jgi:hypothetical protein
MTGESPFSINFHYTLKGWPYQLTIRADTWLDLTTSVDEAMQDLIKNGAVPADMIWAKKTNQIPEPAVGYAPGVSHPAQTTSSPMPDISTTRPDLLTNSSQTKRPVGRPPKRPDSYIDAEGRERCLHTVDGRTCNTVGEWRLLPDKKDPSKTWNAWSCAAFFNHDDYREKHPEGSQ